MIENFENFKNKQFNTVNESKANNSIGTSANKSIGNRIYNRLSKDCYEFSDCSVEHLENHSIIKYKNITITIKGDADITWNDGVNGDWDYVFDDIINVNHFFDELLKHASKSIEFMMEDETDTLSEVLSKMDVDFSLFLDDRFLFDNLTSNDLRSMKQDGEYITFSFAKEKNDTTFNLKFSKKERNVYFDIDGGKTMLIENSKALVNLVQKFGYRFPCDFVDRKYR